MRFPKEYVDLLDVPAEKRTPLEKQIARWSRSRSTPSGDVSAKLKGAEKEQYDRAQGEARGTLEGQARRRAAWRWR